MNTFMRAHNTGPAGAMAVNEHLHACTQHFGPAGAMAVNDVNVLCTNVTGSMELYTQYKTVQLTITSAAQYHRRCCGWTKHERDALHHPSSYQAGLFIVRVPCIILVVIRQVYL